MSSPGLQPWHEGSLAWQGGIYSLQTTKHLMFSSHHCWLSNELGLPRQNRSRPPVSSRDVTENLQVPPRPLSAYYKRGFLQTVPGCGAAVQGFSPHRVPLSPLQNFPSYSPQPPSEGGSQHPPSKNHNNPGTLDTHTPPLPFMIKVGYFLTVPYSWQSPFVYIISLKSSQEPSEVPVVQVRKQRLREVVGCSPNLRGPSRGTRSARQAPPCLPDTSVLSSYLLLTRAPHSGYLQLP